jgi:hypothetical protein
LRKTETQLLRAELQARIRAALQLKYRLAYLRELNTVEPVLLERFDQTPPGKLFRLDLRELSDGK